MPTEQPSSAPQADAPQPTDDLTAAAVLRDPSFDRPVGGGGLGAAAAPIVAGAAAANSPVDAALPHDGGTALAEAEARQLAAAAAPPEPGHTSH